MDKTSEVSQRLERENRRSLLQGLLPSTFRRELFRQPDPVPAVLKTLFHKPGAGLIYKQSLAAFLIGFCDKENPGAPKDPTQVLSDLKEIWADKGALPVDELTCELNNRYLQGYLPAEAIKLLNDQIRARYEHPEELTGFHHKQHAPLAISLAHLQAVLTNHPVTLVAGDFTNMGATNEHFAKLIAAAEGLEPTEVEDKRAFEPTDKAARALARLVQHRLKELARMEGHQEAHVQAFRMGGDEVGYLVTGVPAHVVNRWLKDVIHPELEDLTATLGVHEHEHGKDRDNVFRNGFCLALAAEPLNESTVPGVFFARTEREQEKEKARMGLRRQGRLNPLRTARLTLTDRCKEAGYFERLPRQGVSRHGFGPVERAKLIERFAKDGVLTGYAHLSDYDLYNLLALEAQAQGAEKTYKASRRFHQLARKAGTLLPKPARAIDELTPSKRSKIPYSNISRERAKNYLAAYKDALEGPHYGYLQNIGPRRRATLRRVISPPFATPLEREDALFKAALGEANVKLTDQQLSTTRRLLGIFSPLDPPTGALMSDIMPSILATYAADTAHAQEKMPEGMKLESYGVRLSLGMVGGANKVLHKDNTDLLLGHLARDIILRTFEDCGYDPSCMDMGHEGGGHMLLAMRPVMLHKTKGPVLTTPELIEDLVTAMNEKVERLNPLNITETLTAWGGAPPKLGRTIRTFGDIPDPKRAGLKGFDLNAYMIPLRNRDAQGKYVSGSDLRMALREGSEKKIEAKRNALQEKLRSPRPASSPAPRL